MTNAGPIYGREAIEKHYADLLQRIHFTNHLSKADENSSHNVGTAGNETWSNGKWSQTLISRADNRSHRLGGGLLSFGEELPWLLAALSLAAGRPDDRQSWEFAPTIAPEFSGI